MHEKLRDGKKEANAFRLWGFPPASFKRNSRMPIPACGCWYRRSFSGYLYSALTKSSNRMSTPNTPAISSFSFRIGAETVMQSAPVIFEV